MIDQKRGSIVNIASVSGMGGAPPDVLQAAGYHASKGGVIAFTRDLACEWARYGIRVNAIAPGWFPTHMSKPVLGRSADRMRAGIPLGRFGGQDDLKGAVAFLASDASAYVTGHVLVVDGGQSAW
jgi:gluconate 5-dehydrogenase